MSDEDHERVHDPKVEPLFAALQHKSPCASRGWIWKLVWVVLAISALLLLVIKQAF